MNVIFGNSEKGISALIPLFALLILSAGAIALLSRSTTRLFRTWQTQTSVLRANGATSIDELNRLSAFSAKPNAFSPITPQRLGPPIYILASEDESQALAVSMKSPHSPSWSALESLTPFECPAWSAQPPMPRNIQVANRTCETEKFEAEVSTIIRGNLSVRGDIIVKPRSKDTLRIAVVGDLIVRGIFRFEPAPNSTAKTEFIVAGDIRLSKLDRSGPLLLTTNVGEIALDANDSAIECNPSLPQRFESRFGILIGEQRIPAPVGCAWEKDVRYWPQFQLLGRGK